jgi:hypothetical protein
VPERPSPARLWEDAAVRDLPEVDDNAPRTHSAHHTQPLERLIGRNTEVQSVSIAMLFGAVVLTMASVR